VLRAGDQIFAARWEEWGFSRGFWGEIFRDFFAGWWRNLINGAQRALFNLRRAAINKKPAEQCPAGFALV
jgi:hypothetical protein